MHRPPPRIFYSWADSGPRGWNSSSRSVPGDVGVLAASTPDGAPIADYDLTLTLGSHRHLSASEKDRVEQLIEEISNTFSTLRDQVFQDAIDASLQWAFNEEDFYVYASTNDDQIENLIYYFTEKLDNVSDIGLITNEENKAIREIILRAREELEIVISELGDSNSYIEYDPHLDTESTKAERLAMLEKLAKLTNGARVAEFAVKLFPEFFANELPDFTERNRMLTELNGRPPPYNDLLESPEGPSPQFKIRSDGGDVPAGANAKSPSPAGEISRREVPDVAPKLWSAREPGVTPPAFVRSHYGEWRDDGSWDSLGLTKADLRRLDRQGYQALATWESRHPEDRLALPTRAEVADGRHEVTKAWVAAVGEENPQARARALEREAKAIRRGLGKA